MSADQKNHLALNMETLEARRMLAGNVTASITAGGDLVINGDGDDNSFIVYIDEDGSVGIEGAEGTTIDDSGLGSSVVSGDVRINLRGGDDYALIIGSNVDRVTVNGAAGNDTVYATLNTNDDFRFVGGGGDDYADVKYSEIGGDLVLTGGAGEDDFEVYETSVADNLTMSMGAGDNRGSVSYSSVSGDFRFTAGGGDDYLSVDNLTMKYGDATMNTGGGEDGITLIDSNISGNVRSNMGAGSDNFVAKYSSFGSSRIATGGANDYLTFYDMDLGDSTLLMGAGSDYLSLLNNEGVLTANGNGGFDTIFTDFDPDLSLTTISFEDDTPPV